MGVRTRETSDFNPLGPSKRKAEPVLPLGPPNERQSPCFPLAQPKGRQSTCFPLAHSKGRHSPCFCSYTQCFRAKILHSLLPSPAALHPIPALFPSLFFPRSPMHGPRGEPVEMEIMKMQEDPSITLAQKIREHQESPPRLPRCLIKHVMD